MIVSLNWLSDYVDIDMPAEELGELFDNMGFCCEGIEKTDTDIILDLEITSNRPDLLGHLGIAREVAAATGAAFRPPDIASFPESGTVAELAAVEVREPRLCPRYTARVIRDVTVEPSPRWLVDYLETTGLRSVNNIVDITNFVLLEYSQPLHAFDYDRLGEHRIVVRRATPGETITAIDDSEHALDEHMLVIADAAQPVAIAGIMGGRDTEVTGDTVTVLLESAEFDPLSTRNTSRSLQLSSESNYRFERGVDPAGVETASRRACALICEIAGGQAAEGMVDVGTTQPAGRAVALRPERTNTLLGIDIPVAEQERYLAGLGLNPSREKNRIVCAVPSFRRDITREADLIEEVARLHGYHNITAGKKVSHPVIATAREDRLRRRVVTILNAAGFDETITFSFLSREECGHFGVQEPVAVDSTIRRSDNALRPTLIPSLLKAARYNQDAGNDDIALFEVAAVYRPSDDRLPEEYTEIALLATGGPRRLKGAVELLCRRICPGCALRSVPAPLPGFRQELSAGLTLESREAGCFGAVSSAVREHYGLKNDIAAGALRFDVLDANAVLTRKASPLPKFPPVTRDLSLIVDESVTWKECTDVITALGQETLAGIDYVTTYRGNPIPAGRKSVTFALQYRSDEGTLTGEEADAGIEEIIAAFHKELGAELRQR